MKAHTRAPPLHFRAMPTPDRIDDDDVPGWRSAWPDAAAFLLWLGLAWYEQWTATDLVWSLWLSSFVVGYATIVWTIARPGLEIARAMARFGNPPVITDSSGKQSTAPAAVALSLVVFGGLFLLAFFTIHFGGFHYVHSQFLMVFFPLHPGAEHSMAGMSTYLEVLRRYWLFLPSAFIAERAMFMRQPRQRVPDVSVSAVAIAARKLANAKAPMSGMMEPYRNVMRMHFLIFFFAFAHFAKLENFAVYAVVYTVYFFPWRLVQNRSKSTPAQLVPNG